MTVSQRLYLAVVPAILGVFTVAALAYWGQYQRQAPTLVVIVAVLTSVSSLIVAWRNTRYVATRVSRLAAPAQSVQVDELDTIEEEVRRLRQAVSDAESSQARAAGAADQQIREYAALVGDAAAAVAKQLDEVRIPLHILLETHFGDLNENQEEMVAAARAAADDVHERLDRLHAIGEVDRGALRLRLERIRMSDLIAVLLPGLTAAGSRNDVTVTSDLSPLVPAVTGDRAWLSEALSLLTSDAVRQTPAGGHVRISVAEPAAAAPDAYVRLEIAHGTLPARPIDAALADRLIGAQGGRVAHDAERTVVTLPASREAVAAPAARTHTSR